MISTHTSSQLTIVNDSESHIKIGQWVGNPAYISVNGREIEMDLATLKALSNDLRVFLELKSSEKTWVDMD